MAAPPHAAPPEGAEPPEGHDLITRRICLIKDTGHAGVLWGGTMMAWADEAGAILAELQVENEKLVTKAWTGMEFRHPVRPGDVVEFYGEVARFGETSVTVDLCVIARRAPAWAGREVLRVTGVFVAVDDQGRKAAIRRRK